MKGRAVTVSLILVGAVASFVSAQEFTVEKGEQGVKILRNGVLLTQYLVKSGHKPIFFPVIGANGQQITRGYPMLEDNPNERKDHPHHRSFWFTHGDVNGVDFWSEGTKAGNIIHRKFVTVEGGTQAVLVTQNDWIGPDGKKHCEDLRSYVFDGKGDAWWVDCDITVTASDGKVTFGDTKEGCFGVRVAGTMKVDEPGKGRVVNSEGQTNGEAWGKRAAWVDYSGPVDDQTVGVAILNHPSSFRSPTYWHVRTYGLFTANPFGVHHFEGSNDLSGSHVMEPGDSFTLRHRVVFHHGDEKYGKVAEHYADYIKMAK